MLDEAPDDDAAAIAQVLAGDREAFGLLVARYGRRVHDLARRMLRDASEAEDAVQQAFLNAYRALDRFDARRPFRHWILRITTNLCRNRLAARRLHPSARGTDPDELDPTSLRVALPADVPDDEGVVARDCVRAALEALPENYRLAAVLRYVHGLSVEEIAEVADEPLGTVKTHLFRARAALTVLLAPLGAAIEPPQGPPESRMGSRPDGPPTPRETPRPVRGTNR